MPVWIRRTLIALVAVAVLLGAAVAWFAMRFDANAYKGLAIDWVQTNRHRTLAIDGPVALSLWPRLALKVSKLSLSEPGRPEIFLALDDAALAVAVWPLLRGEVAIGRVDASGVQLNLQRDAKGRRNFDDLLAPGPAAPAPAASGVSAKPMRLDVSGIALSDLRVRLRDAISGVDGEVLVKELKTGRIADGVESPLKLVAQLALNAPAVRGELTGDARFTPQLGGAAAGSLRLADMNLAFKGDAPGASAIDASIKGALGWDAASGAADAKALRVGLSAHTAGLTLVGSTLAIERFGFDAQRKLLSIQDLKLRVRGTQGAQPLELDLDWPALDVKGNALSGSALAGKFSRGGPVPVSASFKSGAPGGSFEAVRLPGFEAQLRSDTKARKVGGTLRANLVLEPQRKALAFDALDLRATVEEAGRKALALGFTGSASATPQAAKWALAGQLEANKFNLDGSADLSGATPLVRAVARFDALDLDAFLPPAAAPATAGQPAADTPVDLSALRSVNGSFGLRAASLKVRQYRIADARIEAVLDAGMLRVNTLQAKVWGGSIDGSAFADARASRIAVKAVGSGVNVNAVLRDVAGKDLLDGTGRVVVDLDTAGRSTQELKSRLRGSATLQLRDGAIKGINLAQSLRQARAALTQREDHQQKANTAQKTDFSEMTASFQVQDGVARNKDLDVKSPLLRLGGEGMADIGKGRIDYTVRATVADTLKGQDGAELAALRGVTVPVRLTGPFEAIDWRIQWTGIATDLLRDKLEDKLKERLGLKPAPATAPGEAGAAPKDKLRDALKGLFK
jgi:AsmA protein